VLRKARIRYRNPANYGGWQIIDANLNSIEAGERFDLSLEDVERWLANELESHRRA
jgi:hypothetical protein